MSDNESEDNAKSSDEDESMIDGENEADSESTYEVLPKCSDYAQCTCNPKFVRSMPSSLTREKVSAISLCNSTLDFTVVLGHLSNYKIMYSC
jgi:hypothetical protein